MHKGRTTGINAALVSAFFLGLAPVFGKAAMGPDKFSPLAVVALRTGMAALLLFLLMIIFRRQYIYIYTAGLLGCALAGGINGLGSIFYYMGLSRLNASVAQMLYALYPFFVAIWLRLDKQPTTRLTVIRIIIACGSAALLTWAGAGSIDMVGVVFMLISAALYAFHIPINQRVLFDLPAPTVTLYTLISMSAVVIPAYLIFDRSFPAANNTPWFPILGLTTVTFFSRLLLFTGVKHIGGMQTALLGLGELLVAVLFSHIYLKETLSTIQWIGMAGLGTSLLLVWFEKPLAHPIQTHGLLSFLQPPDFPADFYKH
jgi:drug/metabolite transporter (DMT)-like permease